MQKPIMLAAMLTLCACTSTPSKEPDPTEGAAADLPGANPNHYHGVDWKTLGLGGAAYRVDGLRLVLCPYGEPACETASLRVADARPVPAPVKPSGRDPVLEAWRRYCDGKPLTAEDRAILARTTLPESLQGRCETDK